MEWAFRAFKPVAMFKSGETVTEADIWLGNAPQVPLVIQRDLKLTLPRNAIDKMKVTVRMKNPVAAPVKKGQNLGMLVVGFRAPRQEYPLAAGADVKQLGFIGRIGAAIKHVLWGSS